MKSLNQLPSESLTYCFSCLCGFEKHSISYDEAEDLHLAHGNHDHGYEIESNCDVEV